MRVSLAPVTGTGAGMNTDTIVAMSGLMGLAAAVLTGAVWDTPIGDGIVPVVCELAISTRAAQGFSGLTANWITRYGALSPGPVFHWLMNTRSSSSVEPGEM